MAFSEFVDRHESALLSFAAAFLRDETLAQDIVQEAFLRAARDPHRLLKNQDNHASGRNWLLKVVRDLSVDSLRKKPANAARWTPKPSSPTTPARALTPRWKPTNNSSKPAPRSTASAPGCASC